jgi:tetratricopeptide (TPR) repeat protein
VTSRRRLTALADDATVSLDVLSAELLAAIAARPGLTPGNRAIAQIAALCEFRPLALGMLGRRLHDRPAWSAAGLAAELAAARGRADLAGAEDGPVAAAFSLAYRGLSAGQQRMFARLGLYPGTEIDAWAGAALLGCDRAAAEQDLAALRDRAGDHAAAAAELTRALRLYREAGSRDGEAAALAELGTARYLAGDARGAAADLEQSLRLYLALGSRAGEAAALNELGHLLGWSGDRPSATRALARSAQLCRDLGDRHGEASAHGRLGALRVLAGDFADATTALAAARRLYRELGHRGARRVPSPAWRWCSG